MKRGIPRKADHCCHLALGFTTNPDPAPVRPDLGFYFEPALIFVYAFGGFLE
jgi:hypothetical protein